MWLLDDPAIVAVQLLNGFIGCGVCLHSLKALSDVVERLALYPLPWLP